MYIYYILIFVVGLMVGSFLNVCIYRIPLKQSIVFPASHCFNCNHELNGLDLIPVFSFIFLKGKCRYCGDKISIQYPLVELANALLFYLLLSILVLIYLRFLCSVFFFTLSYIGY